MTNHHTCLCLSNLLNFVWFIYRRARGQQKTYPKTQQHSNLVPIFFKLQFHYIFIFSKTLLETWWWLHWVCPKPSFSPTQPQPLHVSISTRINHPPFLFKTTLQSQSFQEGTVPPTFYDAPPIPPTMHLLLTGIGIVGVAILMILNRLKALHLFSRYLSFLLISSFLFSS